MKYYIIAGEPSGDLHGSNLMKEIKRLDGAAEFMFWGGDHMLAQSNSIVTHIRETSIMGFVEVVKKINRILSFFKTAKKTIEEFQPDVLVLIDYPGFNLRIAKWAKRRGFKVVYYISPQLWAWKKGRIKTVKECVDEMIVILPFEVDFYNENGVQVHYVGHPLLPVIQSFIKDVEVTKGINSGKKVLAILPGSRRQEIEFLLLDFLRAARHFSYEYDLYIAMAPNIEKEFYNTIIDKAGVSVNLVENDTYTLLSKADLALVTSGTATLEAALFKVPQLVCYKTSSLNYEVGKRLVQLESISLVNLIIGRKIVPELIQHEVNEQKIVAQMHEVIQQSDQIQHDYVELQKLLFGQGNPSANVAQLIIACSNE
ncbi:MAG: lipid-A-disaccharide synthase [Saprospiraceae bacterium]|nr:lipid-A-disaccharide synthase [Saprospiraceae bacterium]